MSQKLDLMQWEQEAYLDLPSERPCWWGKICRVCPKGRRGEPEDGMGGEGGSLPGPKRKTETLK